MTFIDFAAVLALRFLIFDFKHFTFIREYVKSFNFYIINELLQCPFCQGFWTGLFYYSIRYAFSINSILFAFSCAIINFTWYVCTDYLIDKMEQKHVK